MRFAVMLAAVAALFVGAGQARAVIITGFGAGMQFEIPGCISGQTTPACMGLEIATPIAGPIVFEVPDYMLRPDGSFLFGGYIPGCGLRTCSYSATQGGVFTAGGFSGLGDPAVRFTLTGPAIFTAANVSELRLSVGYAPVPELATWALLIAGFTAMGAFMRHRPRRMSENRRLSAPSLPPRSNDPKTEGSPAALT